MSPFSRFAHYFIAVARCGSLRRAAEQLHISASAINRQILQAEEAFGTPLFERLPEGLRMTTAGELLYDNLLRWQKEFRQTRQKFDELQGMKRGSVSVGMVQALAEGGFAAALAEIPTTTPASDALSKALKKRGFKFVGSTICYSFMQACGLVNDHVTGCFCRSGGQDDPQLGR